MIITITGKPCSGKNTVGEEFAKKFGFKFLVMGDIFREQAKKFGAKSITDFVKENDKIKIVDKMVDDYVVEVGKTKLNEDIVLVSRTAWHFIPKSFKVFLDVSLDVAINRLINANRESEKVATKAQAKKALTSRWENENKRYQELYGFDNNNLENYNLVISTGTKSVDEIVDEIYKNYQKFIKKRKK